MPPDLFAIEGIVLIVELVFRRLGVSSTFQDVAFDGSLLPLFIS